MKGVSPYANGYTPIPQRLPNEATPPIASTPSPPSRGHEGHYGGTVHEGNSDVDILQFCSPIYYAAEGSDDNKVSLDIIRFGKMEFPVSVDFTTQDMSAKAGVKYEAWSGTVHMAPGESSTTLEIKVIDDEFWSTVLEFAVVLSNPVNCGIANSLREARVKIIDDDAFPSNRFKNAAAFEMYRVLLMWDYIALALTSPAVQRKTVLMVILDSIHNLYFVLRAYLNVYMVDVLFNLSSEERRILAEAGESGEAGAAAEMLVPEEGGIAGGGSELLVPGDRRRTAILVAILYCAPIAILHAVDVMKSKLGLSGMLEEFLMTSLFAKYMNYSDDARKEVDATEMALALIRDCAEVVQSGYMKTMRVIRVLSKLAIIAAFVYIEHCDALYGISIFGVLMVLCVYCRVGLSIALQESVKAQEKHLVREAHETCFRYSLIADYRRRGAQNDRYAAKIKDLRAKKSGMRMAQMNTVYMPEWIEKALVGGFMVIMSDSVFDGELPLGTYLAIIGIFHEISHEFKETYVEILEILNSVGPLANVSRYMNGESDASKLRQVHSKCQNKMRVYRTKADGHQVPFFDFDAVPFVFEDVAFRYGIKHNSADGVWLFQLKYLEVTQGSVIAVIGNRGVGKTTLLRLLTSNLFAEAGTIFMPTNLKVLNVDRAPAVLDASLWDNLVFGDPAADPGRVSRILQRMGAGDAQAILQQECAMPMEKRASLDSSWSKRVSSSEVALIHLARAFIANPQALVVVRPEGHFDHAGAEAIMNILREFVTSRGLEVEGERDQRRPRTCFYTTDEFAAAKLHADQVWEIKNGRVSVISKENRRASVAERCRHKPLSHGEAREPCDTPYKVFDYGIP